MAARRASAWMPHWSVGRQGLFAPELLAKLATTSLRARELSMRWPTLERYGFTMSTGDDRGQLERLASAYLRGVRPDVWQQ